MSIEPRALSKEDAAAALSISVDLLDGMIDSGELRCIRLGRRVIVPVVAIDQWIDEQLSEVAPRWESARTGRARSISGRATKNG